MGPIVGKITADLITTGQTDLPITPFSIARFQTGAPSLTQEHFHG
jgi:sarcosine oxidase subunit beta